MIRGNKQKYRSGSRSWSWSGSWSGSGSGSRSWSRSGSGSGSRSGSRSRSWSRSGSGSGSRSWSRSGSGSWSGSGSGDERSAIRRNYALNMSLDYIQNQERWLTNSGVEIGHSVSIGTLDVNGMFEPLGEKNLEGHAGIVRDISYGILVQFGKSYERFPFYCLMVNGDE